MRTFGSVFLALALLVVATPVSGHGIAYAQNEDGETAEDAARAIAKARDRANDAVDAWSQAQTKLDLLTDQKAQLDAEVEALQKQVDALQKSVETVAVNRYLGTGTTGIDLLTGNVGPTEQAQTVVLVAIVNEASASEMDRYDDLGKQLEDTKQEVVETVAAVEAAQREFEQRQKDAEDEVERLKVVEKDRLNDEAVVQALEAQRQKDIETAERQAAEQLEKDQAAAIASEGGGSDGGDEGAGAATVNNASSGSSGGTTGGGGAGARPLLGSGIIYGQGDDWVCPIQGATAFGDTYGAARSGGRTHQGVDMISAKGTELVAIVDGEAVARTNTLGGTTISFYGVDGNRYYYAHLDGYAALGPVVKGTVIGFVGETGNAQFSTPHLHFEIHPGGGAAVNPYPTVAANC